MNRSDKFSEIREIADNICSNSATDEQYQQLEGLLSGNAEAKQFYFDYIRVNDELRNASENSMEVVYRQMTEVIVRPKNGSSSAEQQAQQAIIEAPETHNKLATKVKLLLGISLLVVSLTLMFWLFVSRQTVPFSANIVKGQFAIVNQGKIADSTLFPGDYRVEQDAALALTNGDIFNLTAGSQLTLINDNEVQLHDGSLTISPVSGTNITLDTDKFSLNTQGDPLSVDLSQQQPLIITGNNTLISASRWRPMHYWPFEGTTKHLVLNGASDAHGIPKPTTTRVKGLVGNGALSFDNSANTGVRLGSGGGKALATGSFAVDTGISIEALIQPKFKGGQADIDVVFRKGHLDGEFRVNLSIEQGIRPNIYNIPKEQQARIRFGLYLIGHGYQLLNLSLDGRQGRPSLAEFTNGSVFHVVASYDAKTGIKAIFLNGKRLAVHQYPIGTRVLSGGPGRAMIGNNPTRHMQKKYAFSGIIDELAFYNFALPPLVIAQHFKNINQGLSYYGLSPSSNALPEQVGIVLPPLSVIAIDPLTGLPQKQLNN